MANEYFSVKGFVSYGALTNNLPGVIAPVGELSLRSSTFSKDRTIHSGSTVTSPPSTAELTVFSCLNADGTDAQTPGVIADFIVEVAKWAYKQAVDGVFTSITDSFRTPFLAEFSDEVNSVVVGQMAAGGGLWLPSYITFFVDTNFLYGGNVPAGQEELRVRVWFTDGDFKIQYDECDLAFIGPIDNLDRLIEAPWEVEDLLASRTPPELTALIAQAAGNSPYTVARSFNFRYHVPGNPNLTYPAYWTTVIWSDFGDNIDTIKLGLAKWILSNSTHTREEWAEIFPDIFSSTEFIVLPLWNQYAIPNLTLDNAMYSPVVPFDEAQSFIHWGATGTGYNAAHIDANSTFLSMAFKSIACLAVGGPENRGGAFKLNEIMPDYLAVPPSSIDFNRMSETTKSWCYRMFAMLVTAETMTETTDVPPGMSRLKRTNSQNEEIMYLVSNINDVQYLVISRMSLNAKFPPIDRSTTPIEFEPDPSVTLTTPVGSKRLQLNVSASGGVGPYQYTASSADIETGGEINPDTGFLDVTFREYGTNHVDVTVIDSRGFPATANYTVVSTES